MFILLSILYNILNINSFDDNVSQYCLGHLYGKNRLNELLKQIRFNQYWSRGEIKVRFGPKIWKEFEDIKGETEIVKTEDRQTHGKQTNFF